MENIALKGKKVHLFTFPRVFLQAFFFKLGCENRVPVGSKWLRENKDLNLVLSDPYDTIHLKITVVSCETMKLCGRERFNGNLIFCRDYMCYNPV